jgi:secondary thiamine-phosphate synthase enzyme
MKDHSPASSSPLVREPIATQHRCQMIDITRLVESAARKLDVEEGMVIVHVPHTTAGVTINENADPDVQHDLLMKLEKLIPHSESFYQHGEGNSDAHLKSSLVGCSQTVLVEQGKLALGTWQGIYFCEFDGPRRRECWMKFIRLSDGTTAR